MDTSKNLSDYLVTEQIYLDDRTLVYRGVREKDNVPVVIKILSNEYPSLKEDTLDFPAVIQAAQTLSREIQLNELLKKLTQVLLQNSGAEKCILVLPQEGIW